MTQTDEHGRTHPDSAADEATMACEFLDFQRATLAWKCREVDAAGLAATTAASEMTLGGLLKHMALVEDHWFSRCLAGKAPNPPWDTVDWGADRDWEWHSATDDDPEELRALWNSAVDRSRAEVATALESGGFDQLARGSEPDGERPSLRWIVLHMIEEYARHNGHADLLRESVDGGAIGE